MPNEYGFSITKEIKSSSVPKGKQRVVKKWMNKDTGEYVSVTYRNSKPGIYGLNYDLKEATSKHRGLDSRDDAEDKAKELMRRFS